MNKKLEKNISYIQSIFLFLTLNNSQYFKSILEDHYNQIKEKSFSTLFNEYYKESYNVIIDLIFDSIKKINGTKSDKVIEYSEGEKYEEYIPNEWNWFLINNVIHQMIFDDKIELSEYGVEETLEKIYEKKPYFKQYKSKLEEAKRDIKGYVKGYKLCEVIKGIRNFVLPKINPSTNQKNYLLDIKFLPDK